MKFVHLYTKFHHSIVIHEKEILYMNFFHKIKKTFFYKIE